MKKRLGIIICCLLATSVISIIGARENTTRKNLVKTQDAELKVDSVLIDDVLEFHENAIVMKGYSKRAGANKETFMLVNNSNLHISLVEFTLRYMDTAGNVFHERTAEVKCDLPPFQSRQASIKTFDEGSKFYYYKSKSTKGAIAYDIKIKLLHYDVKVVRK